MRSICTYLLIAYLYVHPLHSQAFVVEASFGDFTSAVSIATNSSDAIFVLDGGTNRLELFSKDGKFIKAIGGRGWGNLEFDQPVDVCAAFPLDVYVADYHNRRLQRFDRSLNFIESLTEENIRPQLSGAFYPRASAISTQGELFVLDADGNRVIKYSPNRTILKEFGSYNAGEGTLHHPADIVISSKDQVLVLDGGRVLFFDIFGNYLSTIRCGENDSALAISAFPNGFVVTYPEKIILFDPDGRILFEVALTGLIGSDGNHRFRDAVVLSPTLYILTDKNILRVLLHDR